MWNSCIDKKRDIKVLYFIYLFGVLRRFQHSTGHITTGCWKGRGNQYIQFVRVLYCKLSTNGNQLPAFPLEAVPGIEPRPQRWKATVTTLPPWPHKRFINRGVNICKLCILIWILKGEPVF